MQIDHPITIILIIAVISSLVFFLVMPEYNTFMKLQTDLGIKKAQFNAQFDYYAAITKTYFDLKSRPDDIKKINDALPQNSDLGEITYFLQKTAQENGLIVRDLSLARSASSSSVNNAAGSIKDIVFSIDLLGNYVSLEGFIVSLEKSSRLFEVTSISFNSSPGVSSASFSLQIKTHSY